MSAGCDVVVIGGGPAGCAVAIEAARQGLAVILVERTNPPMRKVCGEVLSHSGLEWAQALSGHDFSGAARFESVGFRDAARPDQRIDVRLGRPARGVPRSWLDEVLLETAAREGVQVRRGCRVRAPIRTPGGWQATLTGPCAGFLEAPRLVLATGRSSAVGRGAWMGWRESDPDPAAPTLPHLGPGLEIVFGTHGGYAGSAVMADGQRTVTHLARATARGLSPTHGGSAVRAPLPGPGAFPMRLGTPAFRLGLAAASSEPGLFCVGDAVAAWPPIVGDGMTAALGAGARLGLLLERRSFGAAEWRRLWLLEHGPTLGRALVLHDVLTRPRLRVPLWVVARSWGGLARLIESNVRLDALNRPGGRAATRGPCTRAGS